MGSITPLGVPLSSIKKTVPTTNFKREAMNKMWDMTMTLGDFEDEKAAYDAYFYHVYETLCGAACTGSNPISTVTHVQILEIISSLRHGGYIQKDMVQKLSGGDGLQISELEAERAVKLAAGLLVPLNFNGAGGVRRGEVVTWQLYETLEMAIKTKFSAIRVNTSSMFRAGRQSICTICNPMTSFPRSFNARQIEHVTGFEIVWTSNLADHLLVLDMDEKIKLHIFHHVKVLQHHLRSKQPIIPHDLISETFDTLSLLLPRETGSVRRWYQKQQKSSNLDPGALYCDYLNLEDRNIEHFKYWGDRLVKLKRAYDGHEPNGPVQWWRDDRKPVQWWTFWIAVLILVLTVVFGFIQSVTAIMQVTK